MDDLTAGLGVRPEGYGKGWQLRLNVRKLFRRIGHNTGS